MLRWMRGKTRESLFVSTVTIGEIERGIASQRRQDPIFADALGSWLDQMIGIYEDRILPIDVAVARRWGQLTARLGHPGIDLLIAATAIEHQLTVATRNVRHFAPTGVAVENPFES